MNKILVIIVTYNAMEWAERCFGSIRNSTIPVDLYIIDNGSTDGTQEYILNYCSNVHFVQSKENLGFGRANNLGLVYALKNDYDYVYLLNQDAWVAPDCFEILIRSFETNQEYGILSPLQCQANGSYLDSNFYDCIASPSVIRPIYNDSILGISKGKVYPVHITMAAHWMISRKCIMKVGGFSPTFSHYGEDINYCHRLIYWDFKMGVVPDAKAVHDRENRKLSKKKIMYLSSRNELVYLSNPNKNKYPWVLYFIRNYFTLLINYHTISYVKYFFEVISQMKTIMMNRHRSMLERAFLEEC